MRERGSTGAVVSALEWLFEHRPTPPPLRAARLRHLAQDFLGVQVTRRLYTDLQARRNKKRVEQSPVAAVSLYNTAVRYLSAVLSSGSLPDLSWPPAELVELTEGAVTERPESALPPPGWNRPERLLQIQQEVSALSLPPLDVDVDWSWTECCAKVLQYVGRLSDGAGDGTPALYRVRSLLRDRLQLLRRAAWPLDEDVGDQPLSASLPWTDIVQCCIEVRTDQLSGSEEVYYLPDELDNFRVPDLWTEYTSVGHTGECLTLDESVTIAKRSLDTSVECSPAVKRRPERHSFGRPTLDVSTHIDRELNVSLDWEQRLRELVDEGDASGAMAPLPPPPPVHLTPPRTGRRASLERQLCQLRAQLSADRRHTEQLDRLLAAAAGGTELPPALVGSPE
ncbi:germinal-center associated nuclear protein-like [Amphibalanus amphitrite]|uniref:germinal-center associated nuclear protein-like n=1 Tax=Amphibalanus amphitrite TaxID=1232801 RepID=UPI001C90CDEE|nr:germinal-center associated nuclear protein-like [Amphibalanus amphitrite]